MGALLGATPRRPLRLVLAAGLFAAAAALNVAFAAGFAARPAFVPLVLAVVLLPPLAIAFGALVERHRALLAWAAFVLPLTSLPIPGVYERLPLPGPSIFLSDLLVVLALGAWLAGRLTGGRAAGVGRQNRLLGLLLVPLALAIALGIARGSERYGASLIGQPFRLVLYAAIALALTDTTAERAWRAITAVFYAGALVQTLWAAYFLATGGSQTDQVALSTGGTRVLAGGTAIYLAGSLVCALLNLELERGAGRQLLHATIAGLATFGIVLTFNRTTWLALALVLPLLLLTRRRLRASVLAYLPIAAVVLAAVALIIPLAMPDLVPTMTARVAGTAGDDLNVRWRQRAAEVALEGVEDERWRGVGFGRSGSFVLNNQVVHIQGDPHNSYIYLLAGGGLLALGSFLLLFAVYLGDALWRFFHVEGVSQAVVVWSLALWTTFAVNALGGPIFSNPLMMLGIWAVMALPGVVVLERRRADVRARAPLPASTP